MTRSRTWTLPVGLLVVAGIAWWLSAERMQGMDAGPTVALGGVGWFTATWLFMMAAMMLPATSRAISAGRTASAARVPGWRRLLTPTATVASYLSVWTLAGALGYLALQAGRSLTGHAFAWHQGGQWLCVAVIATAGGYQLTVVKGRWLTRCHAPVTGVEGTVTDGVHAGIGAGLRCVASSWALMAVLFALGAMSLVWMVAVAGLIALERVAPIRWWSRGGRPTSIRVASAATLLALAVALAVSPGSVPGFTRPGSPAARQAMTRMSGTHMTSAPRMHMHGSGMGSSAKGGKHRSRAMPTRP